MNIQIGDNNDEYNHQLHEDIVDQIDRKLNPYKYQPQVQPTEENGLVSWICAMVIVVILFIIVY